MGFLREHKLILLGTKTQHCHLHVTGSATHSVVQKGAWGQEAHGRVVTISSWDIWSWQTWDRDTWSRRHTLQTDRKYSIEKGVVEAGIFSGSYTICRDMSWEPLGSSFESLPASFLQCVCCTLFGKPLRCSCRSTWGCPGSRREWQWERQAVQERCFPWGRG